MTIIQAIAKQEGWGVHNAIPTRDNNPGDIEAGSFASNHGAIGIDGRFAIFATADAGFAALRALLVDHYIGLSLSAALNKYAPPAENKTNVYIANVCIWTGLTPDTILSSENIG